MYVRLIAKQTWQWNRKWLSSPKRPGQKLQFSFVTFSNSYDCFLQFVDSKMQTYQNIPKCFSCYIVEVFFLLRELTWTNGWWKIYHYWIFSCAILLGSVRSFSFECRKKCCFISYSICPSILKTVWFQIEFNISCPVSGAVGGMHVLSRFSAESTFTLGTLWWAFFRVSANVWGSWSCRGTVFYRRIPCGWVFCCWHITVFYRKNHVLFLCLAFSLFPTFLMYITALD